MGDDTFGEFHSSEVTPNMDETKYSSIVNKAKKLIHDGFNFRNVLYRDKLSPVVSNANFLDSTT